MNSRRNSLFCLAGMVALAVGAPAHAGDAAFNAKVVKLVSAAYSYPRSAELRQEQGRAIIKITIAPSGKPAAIELVQSTGSEILDREAIRIPAKVGVFPSPPGGGPYTIVVPILWKIG